MIPKRITVASVSWRSAVMLQELFARLLAFAEHPDTIQLLISDNLNGADADLRQLDFPTLTIVPVDVQGTTMSVAHATGLNALMPHIDTSYVLIIDPDVAVFVRRWDTLFQSMLEASGNVALGAPYPDWKLGKYHNFPSPPFAFWHTASLKSLDPDWQPCGRSAGQRMLDFALRQTFWIPRVLDRYVLRLPQRRFKVACWLERRLGVTSKDTGWEIAQKAHRRGQHAQVFDVVHDIEELSMIPAEVREPYGALAKEFELYALNGKPVVTHRNPTRSRLSVHLWTNTNVTLYQNQADKAAQTARWRDLVGKILANMEIGESEG